MIAETGPDQELKLGAERFAKVEQHGIPESKLAERQVSRGQVGQRPLHVLGRKEADERARIQAAHCLHRHEL